MEALSSMFRIESGNWARVNPWGLSLMLLGLLVVMLARKLAGRLNHPDWDLAIKLVGLLIAALGTLLALRIIG